MHRFVIFTNDIASYNTILSLNVVAIFIGVFLVLCQHAEAGVYSGTSLKHITPLGHIILTPIHITP
jgi:hypothetical protein